jgi:hypothetical protein
MEQAFFKNIRSQILPLLDNAKDEVVIAMAWFTSGELFNGLLDCLRRNVKVELVLLDNAINFMDYAPDFNQFIKAGGALRIAKVEDGFMHHKFCIIDNQVAITGSYNWTYYAETRNIENIIITDNADTVRLYKNEFESLSRHTSKATESPRYSWDDMKSKHVDFDELNFEIEKIAKARNLPERKVFKESAPIVEIIDTSLNPQSRYNIGLSLDEGNEVLINEGEELPCIKKINVYNYEDERDGVSFVLEYWNDAESQKCVLFDKPISDIIAGRSDWKLNIKIQITLDNNGYLHASITCLETGKTINLQDTNSKYVAYES